MSTANPIAPQAPYLDVAEDIRLQLAAMRRKLEGAEAGSPKHRYYSKQVEHLEACLAGSEDMITAGEEG